MWCVSPQCSHSLWIIYLNHASQSCHCAIPAFCKSSFNLGYCLVTSSTILLHSIWMSAIYLQLLGSIISVVDVRHLLLSLGIWYFFMVINHCLPVYVNAMLAQYVLFFEDMMLTVYCIWNSGRLNARTYFRSMANPTTSLGINLDTMSSAQRVDRGSQRSVRFFFHFLQDVLISARTRVN